MVSVSTTHRLNRGLLRSILVSPQGGIAKDLLRRGVRVQSQAKRNLGGGRSGPRRIDTGHLRNKIFVEPAAYRGLPAVRIGSHVHYARYVHDGTGLHGPKRSLIYPRRAKVLRWRRNGAYVYARYTRGMRPNTFLTSALSAARAGAR